MASSPGEERTTAQVRRSPIEKSHPSSNVEVGGSARRGRVVEQPTPNKPHRATSALIKVPGVKHTSHFLARYQAEMHKYTDAPDIFHQAIAYGVMGSLLTRYLYRAVLEGGVPPRWTNLWVLLVGDSADSRKSTCVSMGNEVLMRVDSSMVAPSDGSPEGFLSHLIKQHKAQKNNAATVLVSSEFSTLLTLFDRSYAASFKPLLLDFYDVPPLWKKALTRNEFEIPQPRVSLVGGIAIELLPRLSKQEDWLGGFFSRCLLVHGQRTRHEKRSATPPDSLFDSLADSLWSCLKLWRASSKARGRPRLTYSKAALKVADQLPPPPDEPNLRICLGRSSVHLMKLAAIEQIDEDPTAREIGAGATERAMGFIRYWLDTVPAVIDECFSRGREDLEGDRLPKRIYRYVLKRAGDNKYMSYREVMRACVLSSDHMRRAINSLKDAGLLEEETDDEGVSQVKVFKDPI